MKTYGASCYWRAPDIRYPPPHATQSPASGFRALKIKPLARPTTNAVVRSHPKPRFLLAGLATSQLRVYRSASCSSLHGCWTHYSALQSGGVARSSQKLPRAAGSPQDLPGAARSCQELPGATRSCKGVPRAARSCQELPGAARSCQERRVMTRKVGTCESKVACKFSDFL